MENTQTFGQFPMRRLIVLVFVGAALVSGVWSVRNFSGSGSSAPTYSNAPAAPVSSGNELQENAGLLCDGTVINTDCTTVEGANPGPVEPLGYGNRITAKANCPLGQVITLYRQHQVVGYGCAR